MADKVPATTAEVGYMALGVPKKMSGAFTNQEWVQTQTDLFLDFIGTLLSGEINLWFREADHEAFGRLTAELTDISTRLRREGAGVSALTCAVLSADRIFRDIKQSGDSAPWVARLLADRWDRYPLAGFFRRHGPAAFSDVMNRSVGNSGGILNVPVEKSDPCQAPSPPAEAVEVGEVSFLRGNGAFDDTVTVVAGDASLRMSPYAFGRLLQVALAFHESRADASTVKLPSPTNVNRAEKI